MTMDVVVYFEEPLTLELLKKLEDEFEAIHDQTFKQEMDKVKQPDGTWKGTFMERHHGFIVYGAINRSNRSVSYMDYPWCIPNSATPSCYPKETSLSVSSFK